IKHSSINATIPLNLSMSKYAKRKTSIPHEARSESLHKYFKPLNEISNQIISPSSEIQPVHANAIPTNDPSQLSFSLTNTSSLVDNRSRLSIDNTEIILCNSFKNISTTNAHSILSTESIQSATLLQSNIRVQSSNTSLLHQNNSASEIQHDKFENNELTERDTLATYLLQIESHVKFCQSSAKESTRLDVSHKEFVEKTHVFIVQLKNIADSLDTTCREQIETINAQLSNIEFVSTKSNDTTSRDPGKLDQHFTSSSHMSSMYRLSIFKNKHSNVECLLSANHRLATQKEESLFKINKKMIETFFDCTLFLVKQGIAFRRDHQEHGNFIQLINLLRRYDPLLNSWFNEENYKSHQVTYTSARSQDEFLEQIGTFVISSIVQQVQNAPFYSIMIDSTPDYSHREIYSLVLRYVHVGLNVNERVLRLNELPSKTGQSICDFILDTLNQRWSANNESVSAIHRSMPEIINTFNLIISYIDDKKNNDINDNLTLEDRKTKQQECDDQVLRNDVDINDEFSRYHHQRPRSLMIDSNFKTGVRLHRYSISSGELLYSELQLLIKDIDSFTELPEVINKLQIIGNGYPNATRVYQFLLALPITVATNERCFPKLKLIKNKLRFTLTTDKMEWLILCSTERDLLENINLSNFADEWSRLKNSRLKIVSN
ncbi:unnamed protein product, partial [Rotaria sp. Silwood2]